MRWNGFGVIFLFSFCMNSGVFVDRDILISTNILSDGRNGVNGHPGKGYKPA